MRFTHIKLKPTQRIETNFNPIKATKEVDIPKESIEIAKKYKKSKKHSDDFNYDIMLVDENSIIYGFDFLHNKRKFLIPEINPTTIFYSNAVMSYKKVISFRKKLFEESPTIKDQQKPINPNLFGNFFQLASNCIINLQSALESFANRQIPEDYEFIDINGDEFEPSVSHKLNSALPTIKNRRFRSKFKRANYIVTKIIELRNEIIHLKPIEEETNTQYKIVYRRLLKFDFTKAILSVKELINFYEPNLIEECKCGKELYYDILG